MSAIGESVKLGQGGDRLPDGYRVMSKVDALSIACTEPGCAGAAGPQMMCDLRWSKPARRGRPVVALLCASRLERARTEVQPEVVIPASAERTVDFNAPHAGRRGNKSPEAIAKALELRKSGLSNAEVAARLGIGVSTLSAWLAPAKN